ncbi:DUF7009 family protein [Mucilaginibacter auburnensis]|uniref:Uncharacterized protein n=1 Tax=Mucilaginibacter auburnensis TaxID=1457233 RepID=A0A2H9VSJ9_9SPHI|nr:hypothetical protein [Mucilaginibacter auburnensis]PJJ83794.1 hypothetical protein CLV57_0787 [Mucilaginibacter auburnensis]
MKIRIKGNSIRYRLSKTEVERFTECGYVEESIEFPTLNLKYALQRSKTVENLSATLIDNTIIIYMPVKMAHEWQKEDQIGFSGTNNKLSLLVEKDFQCLDNTLEDQSDNYPNPSLKC